MPGRVVVALAVVAACAAAGSVWAQPALNDGRARLRDRYEKPRQQQKLDEAVRKFGEEDVQTRLEGVEGLGENADDPKAVDYLLRGAADVDPCIRVKAIDVIGDARVKAAVPLLVQQLFMRDTTLATKQHILASLGKIGDPHATKPMLDFIARDIESSVRGSAVHALGEIGDRSALPALERLAKENPDETLRGLAATAIRKIEQRPPPPVVPPALAQDRHLAPPPEDAGRP